MLKKQLKVLLFSGMGAMGLCLATWGGMSVVAQKQTAEMDALASEFLKQYPPVEQNTSAKTLEILSAKLGLNLLGTEQTLPTPDEAASFQAVRDAIGDYFKAQKEKEQGPLDPIPAAVQSYLSDNQATLNQIQTHLQSQEAPVWSFDAELYSDFSYAIPSYLGLVELRKLLLLKAVTHAQQKQFEQMATALEAAHVLGAVPAQRPALISYLVSLIAVDDTVAIMRHLEGVSPTVSGQLLAVDQQKIGIDRLRFENWTSHQALNRLFKDPDRTESLFELADVGLAVLPSVIFEKPYIALSNTNTTLLREKSHDQLIGENICSLDVDLLSEQMMKEVPWWNVLGQIAMPSFIAQWRKGGDRMLAAELTHHVVQAKALAAEQGQWPETLPNLASNTCPDERWVYEVSPEGEMSLSFSREFDWRVNDEGGSARYLPLTYSANLSDD